MVGALRLEDPDGAVGIETHLVSDGAAVYQVPMTYRGAPLPGAGPADLIVTAEHSVLGTRWIYDAEADPVWRREILRLVRDGGVMEQVAPDGTVVCAARGRPLGDAGVANGGLAIELRRVLVPGEPADEVATAAGIVTGTWRPFGRDREPVTGCLAITVASPSSVSDHPAP
ncbi:MAG: hypothetical protein J2P25_09830 [Nocardiopsaceae bacterium]|nr:hypothetical protein [Nocardiopsaceae bacterium]